MFSEVMDEWDKKYGQTYSYFSGIKPMMVVRDLELVKQVCLKLWNFSIFRERIKMSYFIWDGRSRYSIIPWSPQNSVLILNSSEKLALLCSHFSVLSTDGESCKGVPGTGTNTTLVYQVCHETGFLNCPFIEDPFISFLTIIFSEIT